MTQEETTTNAENRQIIATRDGEIISEDIPTMTAFLTTIQEQIKEVTEFISLFADKIKQNSYPVQNGISLLDVKYHTLLNYLIGWYMLFICTIFAIRYLLLLFTFFL